MERFVAGLSRSQATLFSGLLDGFVYEVRAFDDCVVVPDLK